MTTSIAHASADYGNMADERYCFLRNAHLAVRALNALNATGVMGDYLRYVIFVPEKSREKKKRRSSIGLDIF